MVGETGEGWGEHMLREGSPRSRRPAGHAEEVLLLREFSESVSREAAGQGLHGVVGPEGRRVGAQVRRQRVRLHLARFQRVQAHAAVHRAGAILVAVFDTTMHDTEPPPEKSSAPCVWKAAATAALRVAKSTYP